MRVLRFQHVFWFCAAVALGCSSSDSPAPNGFGGGGSSGQGHDGGADAAGGGTDATKHTDAPPSPFNPDNDKRDSDCDGLSDAAEFARVYKNNLRTDPANRDSDGDGVSDGVESGATAIVAGTTCTTVAFDEDPATTTDPSAPDTDGDGRSDGCEDANRNGRVDSDEGNPLATDGDADGLLDAVEDSNGNCKLDPGETDAGDPDTDGDGLRDGSEGALGTDPNRADTDGDGLNDAEEIGLGTSPTNSDTDMDGRTDGEEIADRTNPLEADSDHDGIADGEEHALGTDPNQADTDMDGVTDGEEVRRMPPTDPTNGDSDGDGVSDGIEGQLGSDPKDPTNPPKGAGEGAVAVCSKQNLQPVSLYDHAAGDFRIALVPAFTYTPITSSLPSVAGAVFDDVADNVSGFVVTLPTPSGLGDPVAISALLSGRLGGGGRTAAIRNPGRNARSLDNFPAMLETQVELTLQAPSDPVTLRNALLGAISQGGILGAPGAAGTLDSSWVLRFSTIVRSSTQTLVVGALVRTLVANTPQPGTDGLVLASDIGNGTSVALARSAVDATCEQKTITKTPEADFLVMSDISASTDNDRGIIGSNATLIFNALRTAGIDFRIGVVTSSASHCDTLQTPGVLVGTGFLSCAPGNDAECNRSAQSLQTYMADTTNSGREWGLTAVYDAISRPGNKFPRTGAKPIVVYVTDEHPEELERQNGNVPGTFPLGCNRPASCTGTPLANQEGFPLGQCVTPAANSPEQACITAIVSGYLQQLTQIGAIAFGIVNPVAPVPCACSDGMITGDPQEAGNGYSDVVNALGGSLTGVCSPAPAAFLNDMVAAVAGAASEVTLSKKPISATLKVSITRPSGMIAACPTGPASTCVVPRSRTEGFDYDAVSNSIFVRGSIYQIRKDDIITVSYRVWGPPAPECVAPFVPDPTTGRCVCPADCGVMNGCALGQLCNTNECMCKCAPGCGGTCAANQLCNQATCGCSCAPDCGGACQGNTRCDTTSCACECPADCGGACTGNQACNAATCLCECPTDCGGRCGSDAPCNPATCLCEKPPG